MKLEICEIIFETNLTAQQLILYKSKSLFSRDFVASVATFLRCFKVRRVHVGFLQHSCVATAYRRCRVHVELCTSSAFSSECISFHSAFTIYRSNVTMLFLDQHYLEFFFYISLNSILQRINQRLVELFNTDYYMDFFIILILEIDITFTYIGTFLEIVPPGVMLDLLDQFFQRFTLRRLLHRQWTDPQ